MKNNLYISLLNYLVTLAISYGVLMVATQGELFLDLSKYLAIDGVILTLLQ